MGTWGPGAFENDAAADWAFALEDGEGPEFVSEAIEHVARAAQGSTLDLDDCLAALAAAEVVAAADGQATAKLPESAMNWIKEAAFSPDSKLLVLAEAAVAKIGLASELKDEWDDDPEWREEIAGLLSRLKSGAASKPGAGRSTKPRPAKKKTAKPVKELTIHQSMDKLGYRVSWSDMNERVEPTGCLAQRVLKDPDLEIIARISSLEGVGLGEAKFTTEGLALLVPMKLQWLQVGSSSITDDAGPVLAQMTRLKTLWIAETKISDRILEHIGQLAELEVLDLTGTAITDDGLRHLTALRKLRELNLAQTRIDGKGLSHLTKNQALTKLALYDTACGDAAVDALAQLSNLKWLSLENTRITDKSVAALEKMKSLTELRLADTRLSEAALEGLRAALPLARIWV